MKNKKSNKIIEIVNYPTGVTEATIIDANNIIKNKSIGYSNTEILETILEQEDADSCDLTINEDRYYFNFIEGLSKKYKTNKRYY